MVLPVGKPVSTPPVNDDALVTAREQLRSELKSLAGELGRRKYYADVVFTPAQKKANTRDLLDRLTTATGGGPMDLEQGFSWMMKGGVQSLKVMLDDGKSGWSSIKTPGDREIAGLEVPTDEVAQLAKFRELVTSLRAHIAARENSPKP